MVRLNYTWYKDNAPVDLKRLNATTFENKLNFSYLDHFIDDGNYSCEVNILKLKQKVFVGYVPVQIKRNLNSSKINSFATFFTINLTDLYLFN